MTSCASPPKNNETSFNRVITAPGITQNDLYDGVKIWLSESFNSAEAVIDHDSEDDGVIIGKALINYPCIRNSCIGREKWKVSFTIKIEFKPERFRTEYSQILVLTPGIHTMGISIPSESYPVKYQHQMDMIKPELLALGDSMLSSITKAQQEEASW